MTFSELKLWDLRRGGLAPADSLPVGGDRSLLRVGWGDSGSPFFRVAIEILEAWPGLIDSLPWPCQLVRTPSGGRERIYRRTDILIDYPDPRDVAGVIGAEFI